MHRAERGGRRPRRSIAVALATVVLVVGSALGGPAGAQAGDVSAAEAAELAREAVTDDDALAELRSLTSVDGRPVDLRSATAAMGPSRAARLGALAEALSAGGAGAGGTPTASLDQARRSAREVLDDDKFRPGDVPKPFKGALEWLGDRLRPIGRFLHDLVEPILDLPGGELILAGALVGLGAGAAAWLIARRDRAVVTRRHGSSLVDPAADPAALDAHADDAEACGDHAAAVRFRYQAGLLRLVRADRLVLRTDTTAAQAARQVADPAMDELTDGFQAVVYGGRPATGADVEAARRRWAELVGAGSRR
ncbi:MAG TPA: DUF4129 domain-containing protein [Aquihabitans sp.]|jgi:hypothetical protein|nr:DUF4129 domain-containing protein [Aquihabitans sp.]